MASGRQDSLGQAEGWVALVLRVAFAIVGIWVIIQQQANPGDRDVWLMFIGTGMCGPFVVAGVVSLITSTRGGTA